MLGSHAERIATMRRGVRALIASAEAKVPKIEFKRPQSVWSRGRRGTQSGTSRRLKIFASAGLPVSGGGIPIEGGVAAAYRREIDNAPDPEAHRAMIENRLFEAALAIPRCVSRRCR